MSLLSQNIGLDASNNSAKQAAGQASVNAGVQKQYAGLFGNAADQYGGFLGSLDHFNLGASIGAAMNRANQDPNQLVGQYGAGANEAATNAAGSNAAFMRSQGYGDGAVAGAGQGFFNRAQSQTNAYAAQQYDPATIMSHLQAVLQAAQSGQNLYGGILAGLGQGAYGAPAVQQVQNPLVSVLGSLASQAGDIYKTAKVGAAAA